MDNEKKYREDKIQSILWRMSSTFSSLAFLEEYTPEEDKNEDNYLEEKDRLQESFKRDAWEVYKLLSVYLESLQHDKYLKDFQEAFLPILNSRETLFQQDYDAENGEVYSRTSAKYWEFISPFEFSQGTYLDILLKQVGVKYLESILKNTQVILNKVNVKPKSEPQVYKEVKFVLKTVFPSSLEPTSGFFKNFKNYEPDILVPELHAAVEYKFAKTEVELKSQIDQISADTKAYTGDGNYKLFYAVFYVTDDFWGIDKFNEVWKTMDYPKNWKAFYIIGK